ncbi:ATP-grasp domain-containing protein [Streptomyces sp. 900105755]|uniref:ATP-grasp domain-containing protein n=1 Tax=unclassified Streptomyces TaxID=2593676 RepID=UPI00089A1FF5|nr:ATP-grasp domain-containing protein [Streptomyces sp. Ag109_O5-10]SEF09472.1 ATP-grasp domain-containing protein [Streptomyces sp. Ag109_O5-10]
MTRQRVVLVSHVDYGAYRFDDGTPFFPPDEYDITLLARARDLAQVTPGQVTRCIPVDIHPSGELAGSLPELVGDLEFDWVVATQERLLLPAARLRETVGVGGMGTEHTLLLRDKVAMKRHFSAHGIRVPEYMEISEPVQAAELLDKFGHIVVKPVLGSSSLDVRIVRDRSELMRLQQQGFAGPGRYEAEEFIAGRQFHIDSVVDNGVPVAVSVSQYLDSHEEFPLDGQVRSHTLDDGPDLEVLLEFNRAVLACISWFSGAAHLEAFLDDRGRAVFCELAGRPGGAGIDTTFRYRHGVSLLFASILPQIGRAVPHSGRQAPVDQPATGWSMIYPPRLGRFDGFDALPRAEWLLQLTAPYRPGELVRPPRQAKDAVAVASVCGKDAAEVVGRLAEVKSELVVSITPE